LTVESSKSKRQERRDQGGGETASMRGKQLNSGICGGLWERKHSEAMGDSAVFLFGWLVHRQTTQCDGVGLVLRGRPLTYAEIEEDTGWPRSKLRRWMDLLRRRRYIEVRHSVYKRMVIRVLNAKKFSNRQLDLLRLPQASTGSNGAAARLIECASAPFKERAESEQIKKEAAARTRCGKQAPARSGFGRVEALRTSTVHAAQVGDATPVGGELVERLREMAGVRAWRPLSLEAYLRRAQAQRQRLAAYLAARPAW
jgi:hypothetical protein